MASVIAQSARFPLFPSTLLRKDYNVFVMSSLGTPQKKYISELIPTNTGFRDGKLFIFIDRALDKYILIKSGIVTDKSEMTIS